MKLTAQLNEVQNSTALFSELQEELNNLKKSNDDMFLIFTGMLIFLMQGGFAFLEAGSVQKKNTVNILIKNTLDVFIGSIAFWAFGYGFAYGSPGNGFVGHNFFFSSNVDIFTSTENLSKENRLHISGSSYFTNWFFQYVFAATAATVVSGAVAERVEFVCYIVYSFTSTGFIYPTVAHWVWSSDGWLQTGAGTGLRMQDFAGSATVHVCGGVAALVGAKIIGPRKNRFSDDGTPRPIPGHSVPLVSLGAFLLFVAFLSFNAGSLQSISGKGDTTEASLAIMNTILSGSFGGLIAMLSNRIYSNYKGKETFWSLLMTINGALAGMVASCAGCNDMAPWSSMIVGAMAGTVFTFLSLLMLHLQIDDPLDAVAVHLGGGFIGAISAPIFAIRGQRNNGKPAGGIIYTWNHLAFKGLAWNLLGTTAIIMWSGLCSFLIFYTLSLIGMDRISNRLETVGIDALKHGEVAYPEDHSEQCKEQKKARGTQAQKSQKIMMKELKPKSALPGVSSVAPASDQVSSNEIISTLEMAADE